MKVHCLFEQSGTFKNEFRKLMYLRRMLTRIAEKPDNG